MALNQVLESCLDNLAHNKLVLCGLNCYVQVLFAVVILVWVYTIIAGYNLSIKYIPKPIIQ